MLASTQIEKDHRTAPGGVQAIRIGRAKPSGSQTRCITVDVLATGTASGVSEREGCIAGRVGVAVKSPVHDHVGVLSAGWCRGRCGSRLEVLDFGWEQSSAGSKRESQGEEKTLELHGVEYGLRMLGERTAGRFKKPWWVKWKDHGFCCSSTTTPLYIIAY